MASGLVYIYLMAVMCVIFSLLGIFGAYKESPIALRTVNVIAIQPNYIQLHFITVYCPLCFVVLSMALVLKVRYRDPQVS